MYTISILTHKTPAKTVKNLIKICRIREREQSGWYQVLF